MSSKVETSLISNSERWLVTTNFGSTSLPIAITRVLYIGVTNRLSRRTWGHREGLKAGFASKYQCKKLVYYEHYRDIRDAIARESQLKK